MGCTPAGFGAAARAETEIDGGGGGAQCGGMKILRLILVLGCVVLVTALRGQGVAPDSVSGMTAIVIITNSSGSFASSGAVRIAMSNTGSVFIATALTPFLLGGAGTYSYVKTGPATARMTLTDIASFQPITYALVFSTQTSAAYGIATAFGTSSGLVILESGQLQNQVPPAPVATGFANMSVRAVVPLNGQVIPGLVLVSPTRVLIRVAGPALAGFGVVGTLPNPKLTVMAGNVAVATNDDWTATAANLAAVQDAANRTGAFGFAPGSRDAAIVLDLAAGNYTCIISGDTGTSGEVILEVYRVPQ